MPRILVIEDMPDSADLVRRILTGYGHEVVLAPNAEDGLALAEEQMPDLIILDYLLPDMDAATFISRLRAIRILDSVPVVACSATHPHTIQQSVGEDAFNGFVHKPFRVSSFMEVIDQHLPQS